MSFDVGDKVVYPHHGAAVVERREIRKAFGETRDYLVLRLNHDELTVLVPADRAEQVGLRPPIGVDEVDELLDVLRKDARVPANWSRRFKNHAEKLRTGDVYQVAEVVRNLWAHEKSKALSAAEREMLAVARRILVSELSLAWDVSEEDADERLRAAIC